MCRHAFPVRRNRRATVIQKHVRMFVQLRRFRRETDVGRRRAVQAAAEARADAAAVVIQKNFRRRLAARQVPAPRPPPSLPWTVHFCSRVTYSCVVPLKTSSFTL